MIISLPVFLDIAIGLFFIYLILGLLASEIQELFAGFLQWRAKHLRESIKHMLSAFKNNEKKEKIDDFVDEIYSHPEIASLSHYSVKNLGFSSRKQNQHGLSYIPAEAFAEAFIDVAIGANNNDSSFLKKLINSKTEDSDSKTEDSVPNNHFEKNSQLKDFLARLAKKSLMIRGIPESEATSDNFTRFPSFMTQFITEIENWFKYSQDRASGTYKRNSKVLLFFVGLLAALLANANTFRIIENLHDEDIRETAVIRAIETVDECKDEQGKEVDLSVCIDENVDAALKSNELPIGWFELAGSQSENAASNSENAVSNSENATNNSENATSNIVKIILYDILGIVITGFAIMMGAPFWFDLLKKIVNVRNAGPKPRSSNSSDRVIENQENLVR